MHATIADWPKPSYGFATPDDGGADLFLHASDLPPTLRAGNHLIGARIECDRAPPRNGGRNSTATNVRAEGDAEPPRAAPVAPTRRKIIEAEPLRRVAPGIESEIPDRTAKNSYRSKADRLRESI
jgi:cold shock CspA family protein